MLLYIAGCVVHWVSFKQTKKRKNLLIYTKKWIQNLNVRFNWFYSYFLLYSIYSIIFPIIEFNVRKQTLCVKSESDCIFFFRERIILIWCCSLWFYSYLYITILFLLLFSFVQMKTVSREPWQRNKQVEQIFIILFN